MKVESRGCKSEKVEEIKAESQVFGLGFRFKMVPFKEMEAKEKEGWYL